MKNLLRSVTAGMALSAGVCFAAPALASAVYLPIVADKGWMGQCDLCHTSPAGADAAVKPFAVSLKGLGLKGAGNTASLNAALAAATTVDSDGDTIPDLTELEGGSDPNVKGVDIVTPGVQPEYGCVGSVAGPLQATDGVGAFAGLFVAISLWLTRRAQR